MRTLRHSLPPCGQKAAHGFSLVELLVTVVFLSILMAGMVKVFQGSIGVFAATSESTASGRRNRMSIDLLYEDLNKAGMVPSDLFNYPATTATNPAFRITPNVAYTGTDVAAASAVTDQMDFYFDDLLPYDATLSTALVNSSDQVGSSSTLGTNASFVISFRDSDQASFAASMYAKYGLTVLFRSSGYPYQLTGASASGSTLTASLATAGTYTGSGPSSGSTLLLSAPSGTGVTLMRPGRYVRYSIRPTALDPSDTTTRTPCLFRDEVTYSAVSGSATPFATPDDSTLVAENVIGFKVMLSGDGGQTWAGGNAAYTTWTDITGPAAGAATPTLNWQFASGGAPARAGMNSTSASPFWFREIPVLVRLDITTRTLNKRTEFGAAANTASYRTQTQSRILVPRHWGLAYQPFF